MFKKIIFLTIATLLALHVHKMTYFFDVWKEVTNSGAPECYEIPGVAYGSEDFHLIKEKQVAIVSSGFVPHTPSNIFLIRLDGSLDSLKVEPFSFESSYDKNSFHPHGLFVKQTRSGAYHLYVVNHHTQFECIDVFEVNFEELKLSHLRRITDPTMKYINNLVVIDDFVFYFTNWLSARNDLVTMFEFALGLEWGDVVFYDGNKGTVVSKNLKIPNGIVASNGNKFIHVALYGGKAVLTFERKPDNSLVLLHKTDTTSAVDNLIIDSASSTLWFAGTYRIADIFKGDGHIASFVSRLTINPDGSLTDLQEVLVDDGSMISFASVAAAFKDHLLVGTVDGKMHACKFI